MGKKKLFISHCTVDEDIMDAVYETITLQRNERGEVINGIFDEICEVVCTYNDGSVPVGDERAEYIREKLQECDIMIAFITDAYLRSIICISEIAYFWAQGKTIIPIIYNGKTGIETLTKLFGKDVIHVSTEEKDSVQKLVDTLKKGTNGLKLPEKKAERARSWIEGKKQGNPDSVLDKKGNKIEPRPFIGAGDNYSLWMRYILANGINQIKDGFVDRDTLEKKLKDKEDIYIVGTTNKGFIDNNMKFLAELVAAGKNIHVLYAGTNTDFLKDVSSVEHERGNEETLSSWKKRVTKDEIRLKEEINSVAVNLIKILSDAKRMKSGPIGKITMGDASTLIRQTVVMGASGKNDVWGWMNLTVPPKRASETIGIEFETKEDISGELSEDIYDYVMGIEKLCKNRKSYIEIGDKTSIDENSFSFNYTKIEWYDIYQDAEKAMSERKESNYKCDLIEVAAQHPLEGGNTPGKAFKERLDRAKEIYDKIKSNGRQCRIFVPGSLHVGDSISLSEAGSEYLKSAGVPKNDLIMEDESEKYQKQTSEYINDKYRVNAWGIYNSADECFVASNIFNEGEYDSLYCVCSANQMVRKKLFYFKNEVVPIMSTTSDDDFHNDIEELFDSLHFVLYEDSEWQEPESECFKNSRKERMPGFTNWRVER